MEAEIEVHACRVVVIGLHEEEHPEEGGAFEKVDDMSHLHHFGSDCFRRQVPKSVKIFFCRTYKKVSN
jgi:hypothetical protein